MKLKCCCQVRFSRSEYAKMHLRPGFALDPTWGAYGAPPDPLAGFQGAALRQGKGAGEREEKGKRREGEHSLASFLQFNH